MNKKYLSNLAANVSGGIYELASLLPERDELRTDLLALEERLDRRFKLVTISCPVEPD